MINDNFRAGYVAIIGLPNVGKSTLLNNFLHQKLAITTSKPQTTRHKILGILNSENYQIVFLDTPGILEPQYKLQEIMVKTAYNAMNDADIILWLVEPWKLPQSQEELLVRKLKSLNTKVIITINKIDLIKKHELLPVIDAYHKLTQFDEIIPISALHAIGTQELLDTIIKFLPVGEPYYPQDTLTDRTERFLVSEIIREKIFNEYGEEIPYSATVQIEEFKEREEQKDYIKAIIYVERESQKIILIGTKGAALKKIGKIAREEIEQLLARPVYLDLWVKIRKNWRKNYKDIKQLGY